MEQHFLQQTPSSLFPLNRMADTCENITFPLTTDVVGNETDTKHLCKFYGFARYPAILL